MNRKLICTLIVGLLFMSSTSFAGKPDWVEGVSKKYPEPGFFIGVGSAKLGLGADKQVMSLASDRARGELAKTVRSQVKVESVSTRNSEAVRVGKKLSGNSTSSQFESVAVSAAEFFDGVEIKDYYKDKRTNTLYALAVLNREKAARSLEAKMEVAKGELLGELDNASELKSSGQILQAMGAYRNAEVKAQALDDMRELYGVIKPAGMSAFDENSVSSGDIRKIINGLRSGMSFETKIEGPAAGIEPYIIRGLGADSMAGTAAKKVYKLEGKSDVTFKGEQKMGEELTVQVYQADVDILVKDSEGKTIGALTWSASANEKSAELAQKSAVRALGKLIEKQISEKLSGM